MTSFIHDGIEIAYIDEGPRDGAPILLIHGFASNYKTNWVDTIWVRFLTRNGRRVIAMDNPPLRCWDNAQGCMRQMNYSTR